MPTIYERMGGEAGVMAAVALFYGKVTTDETVSRFFDDIDMTAQARKQVAFMSRAFGGPEKNQGKALRPSHQKLVDEEGLSDVHFDAVVGHLNDTLAEIGVEDELRNEVLELVGGMRNEVLCR